MVNTTGTFQAFTPSALRDWEMLTATLTFISSKLPRPCILENWDPLPLASHRISFSAITRDPAIQEGRPSLSHQVPGSDLDMASNDGMMLSAFDLTILPINGKSMEPSHAEAPGHGTTKTATRPDPGIIARRTVVYDRLAWASSYLVDNNGISPYLDAWLFFPGTHHSKRFVRRPSVPDAWIKSLVCRAATNYTASCQKDFSPLLTFDDEHGGPQSAIEAIGRQVNTRPRVNLDDMPAKFEAKSRRTQQMHFLSVGRALRSPMRAYLEDIFYGAAREPLIGMFFF
ncbi:hypothetical protein CSAL01_04863 [Colletotrichum salicis]|uniref:Uncharacterized protein n=1 Tax=Colletotrichum salicis TaxID=1209931 RepID=A0A135V2L9_9PEZI|nr:hypothetical protein CSAL01_04863 [Colletotrichum salicis]